MTYNELLIISLIMSLLALFCVRKLNFYFDKSIKLERKIEYLIEENNRINFRLKINFRYKRYHNIKTKKRNPFKL